MLVCPKPLHPKRSAPRPDPADVPSPRRAFQEGGDMILELSLLGGSWVPLKGPFKGIYRDSIRV